MDVANLLSDSMLMTTCEFEIEDYLNRNLEDNALKNIGKELKNITKFVFNQQNISNSPLKKRNYPYEVKGKVRRKKFKFKENISASVTTKKTMSSQEKEDWIRHHHLDQKIQLFFLELMMCSNQPDYKFFIGNTDAQGESAKSGCHAVHSATLPSLHYYLNLNEYRRWKQDKDNLPEPAKWNYLKNSDNYLRQNSTTALPKEYNQADSIIEGKKSEEKLRVVGIKIINKVAHNKLSIIDGLRQYLEKFDELCTAEINKGCANAKALGALKEYSAYIKIRLQNFDENDFFKDGLANHDLKDPIRAEKAKLEQGINDLQSQFYKECDDLLTSCFPGRGRKPANYNDYFKLFLLRAYEMNEEVKRELIKRFCRSTEQIGEIKRTSTRALEIIAEKIDDATLFDFEKFVERFIIKKEQKQKIYLENVLKILKDSDPLKFDEIIDQFQVKSIDEIDRIIEPLSQAFNIPPKVFNANMG